MKKVIKYEVEIKTDSKTRRSFEPPKKNMGNKMLRNLFDEFSDAFKKL